MENNLTVSKVFIPEFTLFKIIDDMHDVTTTVKRILAVHDVKVSTFYTLVHNSEKLSLAYSLAQQARAEMMAEEIVEIADTDFDAMRANNRIRARQWYTSKMNAQKFGDKLALEVKTNVDLAEALQLARARRATLEQSNTQDAEFKHVQQGALTDAKSVKSAEDEASDLLLADILK